MEQINYRMADFNWEMETPCNVKITNESRQFCVQKNGKPLEKIIFKEVEVLPDIPDHGFWESDRYYTSVAGCDVIYVRALPTEAPYAVVTYENSGTIFCLYLKHTKSMVWETQYLINLMGIEKIMLRQNALILHSSFVKWGEKGILFSAPPGTGKSTQADLWQQYLGSETINGDRAGIRKHDGRWKAYGLPYAGSSRIYRNESAFLNAIVVLEQADTNHICRLGQIEAMIRLLPEFSLQRWDANFMNEAMDLITEIVESVPVYLLKCCPDEQAVQILRKTIEKEENK